MATIRVRPRKDGSLTFAVIWRDPDSGKQTSYPFKDHQSAENFRRILDANKGPPRAGRRDDGRHREALPQRRHHHRPAHRRADRCPARTRAEYRRDARLHITPYIGHVPVATLTRDRMRQWLGELSDKTMSDKTIANVHGLLSAAIGTAIEDGHVSTNICKGMRLPRRNDHEAVEMVFLTPADWKILDAELGKGTYGYYQLLFRTLVGTGMRWGEMAALQVGDLNLKTKPASITINRALKRDEYYQRYIGTTKTRRAKRTISITPSSPSSCGSTSRARLGTRWCSPDPRASGSIRATSASGRGGRPSSEPRASRSTRTMRLTVTPRIHDLRHTHASWLVADGIDLLTVQRRLGHESITTTVDRYSHVGTSQQAAVG